MIHKYRPDLVIMMPGSWDLAYVQQKGVSAYAEIVNEAAKILTVQGSRLLSLSMLPCGANPERPVDRVYELIPARFPEKVGFADIEASLRATENVHSLKTTPGSELWPRSYIKVDGQTVLLRKPTSCTFAQPERCDWQWLSTAPPRNSAGPPLRPRLGAGQMALRSPL
jgi:hypothetical protein